MHTCIKDNNNSPHGKFHRCLFPFSSKFPDLNLATYVFYIYSCYMKPVHDTNREPGLPVHLIEYHTSTYEWNYNNKLTDVINRAIRTSKKEKRTRCVIAGNRHYILDLKQRKSAFFLSFIPNFKITQKQQTGSLSTTQDAHFTNFVWTSWTLRFLGNCPPTPPLSQHFAQKEKCWCWLRGGVSGQSPRNKNLSAHWIKSWESLRSLLRL